MLWKNSWQFLGTVNGPEMDRKWASKGPKRNKMGQNSNSFLISSLFLTIWRPYAMKKFFTIFWDRKWTGNGTEMEQKWTKMGLENSNSFLISSLFLIIWRPYAIKNSWQFFGTRNGPEKDQKLTKMGQIRPKMAEIEISYIIMLILIQMVVSQKLLLTVLWISTCKSNLILEKLIGPSEWYELFGLFLSILWSISGPYMVFTGPNEVSRMFL